MAQLAEHITRNDEITSSILVAGFTFNTRMPFKISGILFLDFCGGYGI
jgi:hypothetical protein